VRNILTVFSFGCYLCTHWDYLLGNPFCHSRFLPFVARRKRKLERMLFGSCGSSHFLAPRKIDFTTVHQRSDSGHHANGFGWESSGLFGLGTWTARLFCSISSFFQQISLLFPEFGVHVWTWLMCSSVRTTSALNPA
jgi:hypothetical protein